ncbi:MAG TPA: ATP-dependent protease [Gammaproteobacteria bacterium]|nr:ATP-dependent protease [Gammaproteobacteria bacterium]
MTEIKALQPEQLRSRCKPESFQFQTTDDLPDLGEMVGQERALTALRFGVSMPGSGYNLYALGPAGAGKHTAVSHFLKEKAAGAATPADWVYVNNFNDSGKPLAIRLPAGRGRALQHDMQQLVEELRTAIPAAFESDDYKARIQQIDERFDSHQEKAFRELHEEAERHHIKVFKAPGEFTFAPIRDGEVLDAEAFHKLSKREQKSIDSDLEALQAKLQDILQKQIPQWRRERRERIKKVNDEMTLSAVGHLIDSLRAVYTELPMVLSYLAEVQDDVIANVEVFLHETDTGPALLGGGPERSLRRYQVNLFVDNGDSEGAPVLYEDNPTYGALIGRIEHISQLGALITDFTLIRPGALHAANEGYLILDARKLLSQPYAWEGLKRALYAGQVRIESLGQMLSLVSTVSLEAQPIALQVKVVLLGDRLLYYLLREYDPDFMELFKVAVDFEDSVDRNPDNDQLYAQLVATLVRKHGLRPFDRSAVAAVIEQSMCMVGDREKLTTHMRSIADLLSEASFWAGEAGHDVVQQDDVQRSVDYNVERIDRVRDRMHEEILRDTVMIDTDGEIVGQINGLSVIQLAEAAFGVPTRITATTRLGEGELVDIEREVDLAGPIHSKGVFILSSYLGARYAPDFPLSLSASLTFEQSYGEIEGDSASLAELCALLSSLAGLPIRQSLAVTGSVNQHGQVQAIGGVNEKIEGFFNICNARGLSGDQGVLVPASNMKHLMLRRNVVDAVRDNKFSIYAIEHADQALELLTGITAGTTDSDGIFPEDSANGRVQLRLRTLAGLRMQYTAAVKELSTSVSLEDRESHGVGFSEKPGHNTD